MNQLDFLRAYKKTENYKTRKLWLKSGSVIYGIIELTYKEGTGQAYYMNKENPKGKRQDISDIIKIGKQA